MPSCGVPWPVPGVVPLPAGAQLPVHRAALCWGNSDGPHVHAGRRMNWCSATAGAWAGSDVAATCSEQQLPRQTVPLTPCRRCCLLGHIAGLVKCSVRWLCDSIQLFAGSPGAANISVCGSGQFFCLLTAQCDHCNVWATASLLAACIVTPAPPAGLARHCHTPALFTLGPGGHLLSPADMCA